MVDEVLQQAEDLEQLSFYGLSHWLSEVGKLLERAAFAATAKTPRPEEAAIVDRRDEIEHAQAQFRQAMGAALQKPSLTKRERPLAEEFLKQQLVKLEVHAKTDARAEKPLDKLRKLLEEVRTATAAIESRDVRKLEAEQKQLDVEWKEIYPIYDKWEAGRHIFKVNDELQKFKRRYETCKKAREALPDRLENALWVKRTGNEKPEELSGPPPGWAAVAKRAPAVPPARAKAAASGLGRDRFNSDKPPPRQNRWGSGIVNFAQKLQADIANSVRAEAENEGGGDDDWEEEEQAEPVRPPPPPVPVAPKRPPPLPASVAAPAAPPAPEGFWDEEEEDDVVPESTQQAGARKASAKKKGKAKKKKGANPAADQEDDDLDVPVAEAPAAKAKAPKAVLGTKPGWIIALQDVVSGSLLEFLLRQGLAAWSTPDDPGARLEELAGRLPWASPLGLELPFEWKDFFGLEIDGGPRPTSKRGTAPWVARLQKNVPWLLAHYVTIFFALGVMDALSHFGLLFWAAAAQMAIILAPADVPHLPVPARCFLLQAVHLLTWALFVRSFWQTHIFVKMLLALTVTGHSYIVQEEATA